MQNNHPPFSPTHTVVNYHQYQQQPQPPPMLATVESDPTLSSKKFQIGSSRCNGPNVNALWGDNLSVAAAGGQLVSNATVISNSSSTINHADPLQRRHSSASLLLPLSQQPRSDKGDAVTHPVPEFLCHLFSMVTDPAISHLISWTVPLQNEQDNCGGGIRNIGKLVIHNPRGLQDYVLGKYYRHSRYSSFQRQLNYFGFKKKLHGGKKGKLCACSYVHEGLGSEPSSLFALKRRRVGPSSSSSSTTGSMSKRSIYVSKTSPSPKSSGSPIRKNLNKKMMTSTASVTSSSSTSPSFNISPKVNNDHGMIAKGGGGGLLQSLPSNTAVIVKDSNHANFPTALPYSNMPPLPTSFNQVPSSDNFATGSSPGAILPMSHLSYNNWVHLTGNTNNMMLPFPPQVQINNFHQQFFNNNESVNAPTGFNIQMAPAATVATNHTSKNHDNELARANEIALAAQKSLQRAYRKRKEEAADEDAIMNAGTTHFQRNATTTATAHQYQPQQQQPPPPPHQVQQHHLLLPSYRKLVQKQNQQIMPPNSMDLSAGNDNNTLNSFLPKFSMDSSEEPVDCANLGQQIWAQYQYAPLGVTTFPPPQALAGAARAPANFSAVTTGEPSRTPALSSNVARRKSSPVVFDDLFSKLLSTTLPPAEELFDESSASQLSDFDDAELQALG